MVSPGAFFLWATICVKLKLLLLEGNDQLKGLSVNARKYRLQLTICKICYFPFGASGPLSLFIFEMKLAGVLDREHNRWWTAVPVCYSWSWHCRNDSVTRISQTVGPAGQDLPCYVSATLKDSTSHISETSPVMIHLDKHWKIPFLLCLIYL